MTTDPQPAADCGCPPVSPEGAWDVIVPHAEGASPPYVYVCERFKMAAGVLDALPFAKPLNDYQFAIQACLPGWERVFVCGSVTGDPFRFVQLWRVPSPLALAEAQVTLARRGGDGYRRFLASLVELEQEILFPMPYDPALRGKVPPLAAPPEAVVLIDEVKVVRGALARLACLKERFFVSRVTDLGFRLLVSATLPRMTGKAPAQKGVELFHDWAAGGWGPEPPPELPRGARAGVLVRHHLRRSSTRSPPCTPDDDGGALAPTLAITAGEPRRRSSGRSANEASVKALNSGLGELDQPRVVRHRVRVFTHRGADGDMSEERAVAMTDRFHILLQARRESTRDPPRMPPDMGPDEIDMPLWRFCHEENRGVLLQVGSEDLESELECTVCRWGYDSSERSFLCDRAAVLGELRRFLDEIADLAVAKGYLSPAQRQELMSSLAPLPLVSSPK